MYIEDYEHFINELMSSDILNMADDQRFSKIDNIKVQYIGVKQRTLVDRTKTIKFQTKDTMGSGKTWEVDVQIPDYKVVSRSKKMSKTEKVEMALIDGDIRVNCSCPDFLYKGFKYIGTEMKYSIDTETMPPVLRNPNLQGSACKHTLAVLYNINDYIEDIVKDIK